MNRDRIQGNWRQVSIKTSGSWGMLADSGLDLVDERRRLLAGQIQERHGVAIAEAEKRQTVKVQAASGSWSYGKNEVHCSAAF